MLLLLGEDVYNTCTVLDRLLSVWIFRSDR
jgi:hypothetical protein